MAWRWSDAWLRMRPSGLLCRLACFFYFRFFFGPLRDARGPRLSFWVVCIRLRRNRIDYNDLGVSSGPSHARIRSAQARQKTSATPACGRRRGKFEWEPPKVVPHGSRHHPCRPRQGNGRPDNSSRQTGKPSTAKAHRTRAPHADRLVPIAASSTLSSPSNARPRWTRSIRRRKSRCPATAIPVDSRSSSQHRAAKETAVALSPVHLHGDGTGGEATCCRNPPSFLKRVHGSASNWWTLSITHYRKKQVNRRIEYHAPKKCQPVSPCS